MRKRRHIPTSDVPLKHIVLTRPQTELIVAAEDAGIKGLTIDGRQLPALDTLCDYGLATGGNRPAPSGLPYIRATPRGRQWVKGFRAGRYGR